MAKIPNIGSGDGPPLPYECPKFDISTVEGDGIEEIGPLDLSMPKTAIQSVKE